MINAFKQIRLTNLGVSGANGRLNVNASGLAYYSELTGASGVLQTNIISTGSNLQTQINNLSGNVVNLSGTLTGQYATTSYVTGVSGALSTRLITTGSDLNTRINSLSGTLTGQYVTTGQTGVFATAANLISTGANLQTQINSLSGTLTGQYVTTGQTGVFATAANLISTGSNLQNQINNLSGTLTGQYVTTGQTGVFATAANLISTGSNLQNQINNLNTSLSGSYVTLGTTQTITGDKTFNSNVYIRDLYVTGTQTIVNTQVTNVGSNYLNLNATGGVRDGGLFINLTSGGVATGTGAYIGFDVPSNTFKIGVGPSGLSDISSLDTIATQAYVASYTTSATSGAVLMTNVDQTISGNKTFVNALNLNTQATATGHAVRADRNIYGGNGLTNTSNTNLTADVTLNVGQGYGISVTTDAVAVNTSEVVVISGTQTISGSKTFSSAVTLSTQATATNHAVAAARTITAGSGLAGGGDLTADRTLNIGQGYGITVSADDVAVNTSQVVVTTGDQNISGNKTFYGTVSGGYITSPTIYTDSLSVSTGGILNRFSASNAEVRISDDSNQYGLLFATGTSNRFTFLLNGPSGYIDLVTGIISGKNIYQGNNRVVDSSQTGSFATTGQLANIVYTTGTQTIGGDKTFDLTDSFKVIVQGDEQGSKIDLNTAGEVFYIQGPTSVGTLINFTSPLITGFTNIAGTNIYKNGYSVLATNDTGNVASIQNLAQTGSTLQTQISSLSGTLTGNYVTTQFASATYATLVALNQKINWISGQSQAFTNTVTTGVDTQFITFPAAFTGGVVPTVQVTLDIPSNSDYMYNVAVRGVTTSGFTALYSDVVLETGVVLNVWASKLYGSI